MKTLLFISCFIFCILGDNFAQNANSVPIEENKLVFKDSIISATIEKYVGKVSNNELPILVIDRKIDTTFLYVSAIFNLSSFVRNLPTSLAAVGSREVLVYFGSEAVIGIDTKTKKYIVDKYRKILVDDLTEDGTRRKTDAKIYTYDPIWVKVTIVKNKIVNINDKGEMLNIVPFFKYEFN